MEDTVIDNSLSRQPGADGGAHHGEGGEHGEDDLEAYAGGEILVRHGKVNRWLLIVYLALAAWAIYYLFTYWGGLGPGLAY
jgi:hypothetical protein